MAECAWCEKQFEKGFTAELWNNKSEIMAGRIYCSSYCMKEDLMELL